MFSSANVITGHITSVSGFVTSYLNLRDINRELLERNGQLEMELLELQDQLEMMRADTALFVGFAPDSTGQFPYSFVMADVVNNSVTYLSNYITVNKGRKDGVEPDMGVVSERGVVGIVSTVSDHFSVVIPLLNPKFKLSCKVFPSGIIVGKVVNFEKQHDDNFYSLEVELATDFQALNNVRIIKNYRQAEQKNTEREAKKND